MQAGPHRVSVKSSPTKPRVVVIGAGIGGLSAALDLSTRGCHVTLLEQHDSVGGKMHQHTIAGRQIDAGPTVFTMRYVFDQLLSRAGYRLEDLVDLTRTDLLARHFWKDGTALDLFSEIDRTAAAISDFASPSEARKYVRFAQKSEAVFNALNHSFMQRERPGPLQMAAGAGCYNLLNILRSPPFISLWNALGRSFDDPRLRQLFARYSTYCGSSPFKAPATLMLIAHAERSGVWMLQQGMQALAKALADVAERNSCDINLSTTVQQITCNDDAISGVLLSDDRWIAADAVIYNGELAALANGNLGKPASTAIRYKTARSLSALTLSTVATVDFPNLAYHNVFFGDDYADEFDALFNHSAICNDPTIYVCAQDRDNSVATASAERLFCLMNAPAQTMSETEVNAGAEKLKQTLANHGLQWHEQADGPVIETPDTFNALCPGSNGALYGQPTHGWTGSFKRCGSRTAIKGLYVAGGGVHPGAGVPMVSLSGQLAAASVCADY